MEKSNQQEDYHPMCEMESSKLFETCPINPKNECGNYDYDIGFSFSGEKERNISEKDNRKLKEMGVKTFYDSDYKVQLWGKRLTEELKEKYKKSRYIIL
ncbi:MAG: hypothetical protein ACTSRH_04340 [Promethearchaeota archaeon]